MSSEIWNVRSYRFYSWTCAAPYKEVKPETLNDKRSMEIKVYFQSPRNVREVILDLPTVIAAI